MIDERDPSDPPAPDERPEDTGMTQEDYAELFERNSRLLEDFDFDPLDD